MGKSGIEILGVGSDLGGTMTDMFVIDDKGRFVVGKAPTTPKNEAVGFWESLVDAFEQWGINWQEEASTILPSIDSVVYCGTAMLNALLTGAGKKIGLIITKGFEDTLLIERGAQTHAGYSFQDKLHKVTHIHNKPLIPKKLIRGVTERIDVFGEATIPIYENEAKIAVSSLLDKRVEGIAVLFLYSFLNAMHEKKLAEIATEVMREKGLTVPLYLSSEIIAVRREISRLNATVLQACAAEPVRKDLYRIEKKLKDNGYRFPLQITLSDGGLANIRYPALFKACFSGPIGGILGGRYLCQELDMANLLCTDMGGTSFDVGLIMGGEPIMLSEVELGRSILNIPTLLMDSIGAGCGSYLRVSPESKTLDIGPDSAGSDPGPVACNQGNDVPTVLDCILIMGILNPDYYLGGKVKLYKDLAFRAIKEKCAAPLNMDPYQFAERIVDLINIRMKEHIKTILSVRGYSPMDYFLIGYGGAGPMFLSGYSEGLNFKGVFTVPWAAGFSAFGSAVADYVHRYQRSTMILIPEDADDKTKMLSAEMITTIWGELERISIEEIKEEGLRREEVKLLHIAYIRYAGQLEDVEVVSPSPRLNTPQDVDKLIAAFEEAYSHRYTHGAKYPEAGYQILDVGLIAFVPKEKLRLSSYPLDNEIPAKEAFKGYREVFVKGEWKKASIYEMEMLQSGNEVKGLSILEAPSTTMFIPEKMKVVIDEFRRYWLREIEDE